MFLAYLLFSLCKRLPPEFIAKHGESLLEDCTIEMPNTGGGMSKFESAHAVGTSSKDELSLCIEIIYTMGISSLLSIPRLVFHIMRHDFMSGCIPSSDINVCS